MVAFGIAEHDTEGTPPLSYRHPQLSVISRSIFVGGRDGSASLWDVGSGTSIWSETLFKEKTARGRPTPIRHVSFSSDDRRVAAFCGNKLIIWQVDSRQTVETHAENGDRGMFLAISSNGNQALSASKGGKSLKLWDLTKGNRRRELAPVQGGRLRSATFSANGKIIVGWTSQEIHVWNTDSGDIVNSISAGMPGAPVWRVAVSSNSETALVGTALSSSRPMRLQLFDLSTGQNHWEYPEHVGQMTTFERSSDGRKIFCCSRERGVKVWDETGKSQSINLTRWGSVDSISLSPDDRLAIFGTTMRAILYDLDNGRILHEFALMGATGGFLKNGKLGLITHDTRSMNVLKIMDLQTGLEVDELVDTGGHARFNVISTGGRFAASSSYEPTIKEWELKLWDVEEKTVRKRLAVQGAPPSVAFSPDESLFLFGSPKGRVSIVNMDGESVVPQIELGKKMVHSMRVSTENKLLLAICGNDVILWNLDSHTEVDRINFPLGVGPAGIRFLPGKNSFLVGTPFATILVFEFSIN